MNHTKECTFPLLENRDFYVDLGRHITFYRKRAKVTQKELARRVNVSRPYICRIESSNNCQSFSLELLFNICRELNVEPQSLFEPYPVSERNKK